jgi:hypothetical protein
MTAPTTLRADHAAELTEVLEFIHEWLSTNRDNDALRASLRRFSFGLFTIDELRAELGIYVFLLGGDPALLEDN